MSAPSTGSLSFWVLLLAALLPALPAHGQIPALPQSAPAAEEEAETPSQPVEVETAPGEDQAIERRLEQIYSSLADLQTVEVTVRSGVVRLSGEVLSEDGRQQAVAIARQLRGVVEVEDEMTEVRDLHRRLALTVDNLRERLTGMVVALPIVGVAILVVVLFWIAGAALARWDAPFRRLTKNRFLADLTRRFVRVAMVLVGTLLALEVLDATAMVAAVAGAAGLAGLAIGFAFRDMAENYIASVLLSIRQPFLPSDHVLIEGHEGRVVRLTSRATVLMTLDGNHVRIPNADVFKGVILNYSRNPKRRFDFTLGVDSEASLPAVLELGTETLRTMPGVLPDPPVQAWIDEVGESDVVVHFFAWIDQRGVEWAKARGEAIRRVKEAFDEAGVALPEPIYRVRFDEAAAEPARERRPRPPAAEADLARDTHLDREIDHERATSDPQTDLLDRSAPIE